MVRACDFVVAVVAAMVVAAVQAHKESTAGGLGRCPHRWLGSLNAVHSLKNSRLATLLTLVDTTLAQLSPFNGGCSLAAGKSEISKSELRFYYGEGERDFVAAPLGNASSLMEHPRFNRSGCAALYVFGYQSDPDHKQTRDAVRALVGAGYNVLLLDWSAGASLRYGEAVGVMAPIGALAARGLRALQQAGARLCFAAGHSLGAQMLGYIARPLRNMGAALPCAVALDAAGPLFEGALQCGTRLRRGDADRLVALHTDACGVGSRETLGDVNFYPNGGVRPQPSCAADTYSALGSPQGGCSHVIAVDYFVSALREPGALPGRRCSSWADFKADKCNDGALQNFFSCDHSETGAYYMETTKESPTRSTMPLAG